MERMGLSGDPEITLRQPQAIPVPPAEVPFPTGAPDGCGGHPPRRPGPEMKPRHLIAQIRGL